MNERHQLCRKVFYNIDDQRHLQNSMKLVKNILDANYHKVNLVKVTNNCKHLVTSERTKLLSLLQRYKPMFDRTLGQWRGPDLKIELKEGLSSIILGLILFQKFMKKP